MDTPPPKTGSETPENQPRKIRTWWHPLLASLLRWQLGSHYHVVEEVSVGQMPLQIDIMLLYKGVGELPESARRILAGLAEYLGLFTLVEFKGPTDTLRVGDFQTFLVYALLFRIQNQPLLEPGKLHLLVLAPKLTQPYRDELRVLGVTAHQQEPGIWRLQGGLVVHPTWVLETEVLAGLDHPLLTLISPRFLKNQVATCDLLRQGGYNNMVVYLAQQISQFRQRGKEFAMQHLGTEDEMQQAWRDLLATLSPEERLEGMSPEEMHQAGRRLLPTLSPEERLEGLTAVERERLRLLLQQPPPGEAESANGK